MSGNNTSFSHLSYGVSTYFTGRFSAIAYSFAISFMSSDSRTSQFIDLPSVTGGISKIVETTLATSLAEIGEIRAEPNGNLIVPSLAIDEAAMLENKGSRKSVDLTCATGTPDQLRTCSPSQCCCCWGIWSFQLDSSGKLSFERCSRESQSRGFLLLWCCNNRSLKI